MIKKEKESVGDKLGREMDIIEILTNLEGKIDNCKTRRGVYLLECLEHCLNDELDDIQAWFESY